MTTENIDIVFRVEKYEKMYKISSKKKQQKTLGQRGQQRDSTECYFATLT